MNINQLSYLAAIVENGNNITRASRRMGVTQPNVSRQIGLLEKEMGTPLFERAGRRLQTLTPAGRQLFRHALKVREELAQMREEFLSQMIEHTVVVGATAATVRYVLPNMLTAAELEIENLSVEIETLPGDAICQTVLEGRCDIGLMGGPIRPDPHLIFLPWYCWRYRIIFPHGSRIGKQLAHNSKLLQDFPIAACASLTAPRPAVLRAMEKLEVSKQIDLITPDPDKVKVAVRSNGHIGLVAEMAYSERRDTDLGSCESPPPFPTLMAWIVIGRRSPERECVATFLNSIAPHLRPEVIETFRQQKASPDLALGAANVRIPRYG